MAMEFHEEVQQTLLGSERPYHSKRPHRKSRAGCKNCKTRKVKCDEARPSCRACTLRKEKCCYPTPSTSASPKSDSASLASRGSSRRRDTPDVETNTRRDQDMILLTQPAYSPPDTDATDMKLLWFYTTKTYESFSTNSRKAPAIEDVLKIKIIQYAFSTPFLMNTILGITAQHMKFLNVPVPDSKAIAYRANAFAGYRKAIEEAKPETFPALLASSLLLCAVSTAQFRDEDAPPLYILDWILVWRGIGLIIDFVRPEILYQSGMESLFFRPPIDLNTSALHIPSNLLFMVTSLKEGDEDFPNIAVYYETLKYLGALYRELLDGFSGIFDLRIITFYTFLPREFIDLARKKRPRALVIIAHHLSFVRCVNGPWWMLGIADREIENICNLLDSGDESRPNEWTALVRVPRAVNRLADRTEIAKVLLDNHAWTPPPVRRGDQADDERTRNLGWVDDTGKEIAFKGEFVYQIPTRQKPRFNKGVFGTNAELTSGRKTIDEDTEYLCLVATSSEEGSGSSEPSPSSSATP
ncbi:hypothetical protein BR93DRAFT_630363 [Coniochaeta sp. PMI_546]|nr:hypothetical protein BR93DRAFT_630363 [Coniochaeta sp. PMI_546]